MNAELQLSLKKLVDRARTRGGFGDADLAELLPQSVVDSDQLDDIRHMLVDFGLVYTGERAAPGQPTLDSIAPRPRYDDVEDLPLDGDSTASEPIVVIGVGAEGGRLSLIGQPLTNGWRYRYTSLDQSAAWLEDGDDISRRQSPWVQTWRDALAQLDRYPWARLAPLAVHPAFRTRVLDAVRRRLAEHPDRLQRWMALIHPDS
jgi:hypothetical protein